MCQFTSLLTEHFDFFIVSAIPQRFCLSLPQANGSVSKLSGIDSKRNNSLKV